MDFYVILPFITDKQETTDLSDHNLDITSTVHDQSWRIPQR